MAKIKRALLSVFDKTGIVEFAKSLSDLGIELLSTEGTAQVLKKAGIPTKTVEEITEFSEMLQGRVKTLHPKLHGGILACRDKPKHINALKHHKIEEIDLVVVNLYPFKESIEKKDITLQEAIEQIDIGGVALLRSAAKNFKFVGVVCNPSRYSGIIKELKSTKLNLSDGTLSELAIETFKVTSEYDSAIYKYLEQICKTVAKDKGIEFPQILELRYEKLFNLRYGENPHQRAAFYKEIGASYYGLTSSNILWGKELSFNNIIDLDACISIVSEFDKPTACIVKHASPCGVAMAETLESAYEYALKCDRLSAYGGVAGFNCPVDAETAERVISGEFTEAVIAPGYIATAVKILKKKKNLRIIECKTDTLKQNEWQVGNTPVPEPRFITGGCLLQEKDTRELDAIDLKTVTKRSPTKEELNDLIFAWKVVKFVKSNAIVIAKNAMTVGIGSGQPSRVGSVEIALTMAGNSARGAVLASDAFFPRRDGVDAAAKAGITAIIQTGGSIRDEEVIQSANEAGLAMLFTGMRHFRH